MDDKITLDHDVYLKLLQDGWLKIWQMYLTWFAWHFGIHVGALAAFIGNLDKRGVKENVLAIVLFMIALNFTSIVASWQMRKFDKRVYERAQCCAERADLLFGDPIAQTGRWATLASNVLILVAWVVAASMVR